MKNFIKKHPLFCVMVLAILVRLIILGGSIFINSNFEKNWVRFDGEWYLDIVKNGYDSDYPAVTPENIICNQGTGFCQRNFAFFPLYPISVNSLHSITGLSLEMSGILISNLAFIASVFLLYKLVQKMFNTKTAIKTAIIFSVFPLSYVFSAFMSESLFLLLLLATILLTVNKKYLFAGICGALLSATRNTGILVLIPMLLIFINQKKENKDYLSLTNWKEYLGFAFVPIGLIAFMGYLNFRVSDPLAFVHIQTFWEKPVNGIHPLLAIPFSIINYSLEGSLTNHLYNLFWFFLCIVLFFVGWKKKLLPISMNNILLWIFVPLLAGSMLGIPRYIIVLFPIYIIIAKIIKNRKIFFVLNIVLLFGLLALTLLYLKGYWITV